MISALRAILTSLLCMELLYFTLAFAGTRTVAVDQIGYVPTARKYAFTSARADSFALLNAATGEKVFGAPMSLWMPSDPPTGQTVYRGEFSSYQQPGRYRVVTSRGDTSSAFTIADTVYRLTYRYALKGFYFQRCGVQLSAPFAGVYQHPACHIADGIFHSSSDTSGSHAATGGWHDAGDYGKYVVNAGISVGTLLMAFEMFSARFNGDDLNIPESGNGVPDILDEVRYELEWILAMQRGDGGFWFKLTRAQFEGFVMPQTDNATRYIYQVSSTATGDAAACLARASRLFQPYDSAFARHCLEAAKRGWEFLARNPGIVPSGGFKNPVGTATGEYGDGTDSDERLWASAELFETTGDSLYNAYVRSSYGPGSLFGGAMWWGDVKPLALLTYLRSGRPGADVSVKAQLRSALLSYCTSQIARRNASGYHVVLRSGEYTWGSNSAALNAAILLIAGFVEAHDSSYIDAAVDQLHYVLGVNGLTKCFVTGLGEYPVRQPHHRPSASDGIPDPIPGLLAGGPDQYRDDDVLKALYTSSTPPALCYADSTPSYASNEIAINWNAPLVFVAGYFNGESRTTSTGQGRLEYPERFNLNQNFPNPFNPTTTIEYQLAENSVVSLIVYDVLGRRIRTLVEREQRSGVHRVIFDSVGLASGLYLYRLVASPRENPGAAVEQTRKMFLLK